MLLDLVFWCFMIALVPMALGLACRRFAEVARGLASILRDHVPDPRDSGRFPHS